jgi:hypothetical protein
MNGDIMNIVITMCNWSYKYARMHIDETLKGQLLSLTVVSIPISIPLSYTFVFGNKYPPAVYPNNVLVFKIVGLLKC